MEKKEVSRETQSFYEEVDAMFAEALDVKKDKLKLRIKQKSKNKIFLDSDYSKVFYDSDMNIYKLDVDGKPVKLEDSDFETIIIKKS